MGEQFFQDGLLPPGGGAGSSGAWEYVGVLDYRSFTLSSIVVNPTVDGVRFGKYFGPATRPQYPWDAGGEPPR